MLTRVKKHFWYYTVFVIMQVFGFGLFMASSFSKPLQTTVLFLTTGLYIAWALLHQQMHHSLTKKIVVEYVLVGMLGMTISFFLFNA